MEIHKDFGLFAALLISAVLISRAWNLVLGNTSVYLFGSEMHHIYLGIILVLISGFTGFFLEDKESKFIDLGLFGFGTGLILDELTFIMFTPDTHPYYFKPVSFGGALTLVVFLVAIFYVIYYEEIDQ